MAEQGACYICLDDSQEESPFVTPNPCKCKGTIRIHETCLEQVMNHRRNCGICKTIYARFVDGLATIQEKKMIGIGYELLINYTIDTNWVKQGIETHFRKRIAHFNMGGIFIDEDPVLVKKVPYKDGLIHGLVKQLDIINPMVPRSECIIRQSIPYVEGKIHGLRSMTYIDTIAVVPYVDGKEHGQARYTFMNGRLAQSAQYVEGLIVGKVVAYYEDGSRRSEKYFNEQGQLHGLEQYWLPTGILKAETNYQNGRRHGLMKEYFANGTLRTETNFKRGLKDGLYRKYNEASICVEEINYDLGLMVGIYKSWYDNGSPLCEAEYINGIRFGYLKTWHENGVQASEVEYINNKRYGAYSEWDEAGNLISVQTYDEDPYEEEEEEPEEDEEDNEELFEDTDEEDEE